jgi:O-antigen chain-terminating methyltransferase
MPSGVCSNEIVEPRGSMDEALVHADVGLPVPKEARFRFLKRVIARLGWLYMHHQVAFNRAVIAELSDLGGRLAALQATLDQLPTVLDRRLEDARSDLDIRVGDVKELVSQQGLAHRHQLDLVQRQAFQRHHEELGSLRSEFTGIALRIGELQAQLTDLQGAGLRDRTEARVRQAQIDLFLNEVRRSLPEPAEPQRLAALPSAVDNAYGALEEVFRGPFDVIKERAGEYLADVLATDRQGLVLDIGCGRGEWLELLKEAGIDAYGVDLNEQFVAACEDRGLDVRCIDAVKHLMGVPEGSLAAVTAFHIAEHLSIDSLVELLDLSLRALQHGGLLVLETPNPDNLVVGASTFYLDPTHERPLNSEFLAFLVGTRGFVDVEVRLLHPSPGLPLPDTGEPWASDLGPVVAVLNDRLFGAMDYALVARRL